MDNNKMVDMFANGVSMRKIAKHFNCTYNKISKVLYSLGYTSDYRKNLPEQEVIDFYFSDDKITRAAVADKFGVSADIISRIFKKNGIKIKAQHFKNLELDQDLIVDKYTKRNMSMTEIADLLDISPSTVDNMLRVAGVTLRTDPEVQQKYTLDESFFEVIDTEEKAYWLGFMFSDGLVGTNLRDFGFALPTVDKEHVQKFIDAIKYTDIVDIYNPTRGIFSENQYARCVPSSRKICADLISHGCIPRETHTFEAPVGVPEGGYRHFVRGVLDGDGGIYLYDKTISVELVGSYELLDCIRKNSPLGASEIHKHKSVFRIRAKSDMALYFAQWLYKDASVYLDRKCAWFLQADKAIEYVK